MSMDMADQDVLAHLAMADHTRRWDSQWQVPAVSLLIEDLEELLGHVLKGYTGRYVIGLSYKDGKIVRFHAKDSPVKDLKHKHTA